MEGGNTLVDWISYGILGFVLFALAVLVLRSAWFFLSLLAIPLTDTLARRTRLGGAIRRWGERGAPVDPRMAASDVAHEVAPSQVPRRVRVGAGVGAVLGALPGVWFAIRGATLTLQRGETVMNALAQAALGIGLVASAGLLVGTALGAGLGLALEAFSSRRSSAG
ncbi:hypothetical protein [Roseisolibacter sp. H3M3-2]|uniref:hypothetical protein n=1 Tax=Roseisolibacter sp. H3M3-2 TaxID=3031323 RepID=UPI0023DCD753|nr:hypothetical protein [Roseisolibacter sp. H3M3-2]MDF1504943.1 hypothetical protein [Roseisolibacter sp. H3M3-2]